jgi:Phage portal protein/ParB-like nuclease domain
VAFRNWFRRNGGDVAEVEEATRALTPAQVPERAGYAYGIPMGGLTEYSASTGGATGTDRASQLAQLYDSYLTCPWAWACVQAVARTITAGGLVMDWDTDTGEGSQEAPEKTESVLAVERLFDFTNDRQNIRQLLRNVVVDLLVFGDALIEIVWWANTPVALYNLDNPTTTPLADEHGKITGYKQVTEYGAIANFEPRDVLHISLDAPRSGVFGVSPTQAALLPITAWLFAAACGKEMARKGLPINLHVDFPQSMQPADQNRWLAQYAARNIGPRNIGTPVATKGGAHVAELAAGKIGDILAFLDQKRDEILASYGVPPAKAGVIESGNLGGGTGEAQDATFHIDVCGPIAELVLEAVNFSIVQNGFGVDGWHAKFREVDYRTSKVRDDIRDERIRNGTITINRARAEIGEPPVDGGDDAVIIDRQNMVMVADLAAMSKAVIAGKGAPGVAAGETPPGGEPLAPDGTVPPETPGDGPQPGAPPPKESVPVAVLARYRARLTEALRSMPVTESAGDAGSAVYAQLAKNFGPSAIAWVKGASSWSGPKMVPLDQVDTSDRSEWDASSEPDQLKQARKKLRRKLAAGQQPKPAVLVKVPGSAKYVIADGHHRFLAALAEGQESFRAFTGKVDAKHGDWETLGAAERGRDRAA